MARGHKYGDSIQNQQRNVCAMVSLCSVLEKSIIARYKETLKPIIILHIAKRSDK